MSAKKEENREKTPRVGSSFCTLATRRRINVHELKFVNLCVCVGAQRGQHLHHLEAGLHPSSFRLLRYGDFVLRLRNELVVGRTHKNAFYCS